MADFTIDVDEKLKKDAEALFNRLGLDLSSAITMFLKNRRPLRWDSLRRQN